jgi:mono/diheme cytochrome c family protein
MRVPAVAALALAVFTLAAGHLRAQAGDPARGRALAEQWCARCHVVAPGQKSEDDVGIPSFMQIAAERRLDRRDLIALITIPHLRMPPPVLTETEAEHVVTYILWLRLRR